MIFREYIQDLWRLERGSVRQNRNAFVKIALVYPNRYHTGMASLGFQTVYRLFNDHPEVRCERAFLYGAPFDREIKTMESEEPLSCFDLVGFSFSFELDLFGIIHILMRASIQLLAQNRMEKDPLVMAGGVITSLNPAPLLPFVDGLVVGEAEGTIPQICQVLHFMKRQKNRRIDKLQALSEIEGVFIPKINKTVNKQILTSLDSHPTYTPIVTQKSHFGNMFVVEVGRGCSRGCLFCAAKTAYHPYRFRSMESIVETVARYNPGAHRIGLEGAALSDYPNLELLCEMLVDIGYEISLASIRADRVTPHLVDVLERGKVRSFTIAPEAGSEDLRRSIGKGMDDDTLRNVVHLLKDISLDVLKLYFLIGLPDEKEDDVQSIVGLARELADLFFSKHRKRKIRLSVNAFIPKPFTEFQVCPMASEKMLTEKRKQIKRGLKREKNIILSPKSSRNEILQGVLSMGNDEVGLAMGESVVSNISWKQAVQNRGIDIDVLIHRKRALDTNLPWYFIQNAGL
ncbi:radical SAM protein [bacterium]|nr:radical SAM protein [bacterium]